MEEVKKRGGGRRALAGCREASRQPLWKAQNVPFGSHEISTAGSCGSLNRLFLFHPDSLRAT